MSENKSFKNTLLTLQLFTLLIKLKKKKKKGLVLGARSPWGASPLAPLGTLIISTHRALTAALENGNRTSCSSIGTAIIHSRAQKNVSREILEQYTEDCCNPALQHVWQ